MNKLRYIFQNRNLTLLWLGQMASQSGDSIYQIGIMWLVLELTGSESTTGLVAMAAYLPAVVLSLLAGVVVDRFNRRRIMLSADAFRFAVVLLLPIIHLTGRLTPLALGINAFALAIAATFFNPARDSFIPEIIPKRDLMRANSLIQSSWQFSLLLGPALAGVLLHYIGNIHLFTVDSFAYLFSFFLIFLIRQESQLKSASDKAPDVTSIGSNLNLYRHGYTEIIDGLSWTVKHPVILPLLLITIADNIFIMGPAIVGTPVMVKIELGLGASSYALIMASYAVGMLLGTAGLLAFGGKFKKGQVLLVGMMLDGITFVPMYFVNSIEALSVVTIVHSLAIPMLTVSRASLIQSLVPSHITGRIFALVNFAVVGMSALSAGASGFALGLWGARVVFLFIGIGGTICGILGWIFAVKLRDQV
ncbi:MFS transporter [bacterium]|nr:MFS transporter [bacterium]